MRFLLLAAAAAVVAFGTQALSQTSLGPGNAAPGFTLPAATKDSILSGGVSLSDVLGSGPVILAFYPADWSGGCTKEMCSFRDNFAGLEDVNARVFGISGDYVHSHRAWARHHDLPFTLLSDHDHSVARAYSSFNERTGYNLRTVYVIDNAGLIVYRDTAYSVSGTGSFDRLIRALGDVSSANR